MTNTADNYDASSISVLKGLMGVRRRPGMYIGTTDRKGINHLYSEIFDNAVDEALAGHCDEITIELLKDDVISIQDNGRGIPVDLHPVENVFASTLIFTELHSGGKFDSNAYKVSGGLHGVGSAVTNALSRFLEIYINKNGKKYYQSFEKGILKEDLKVVGEMEAGERNGTKVVFAPDLEVFEDALEDEGGATFDLDFIKNKAEVSTLLIRGLKVNVIDKDGNKSTFFSENGILDLISENVSLREEEEPISSETIYFNEEVVVKDKKGVDTSSDVEVAMYFLDRMEKPFSKTYVNNIETKQGGKHVIGFRSALAKVVSDYAIAHDFAKEPMGFDDILRGCYFVISLRLEEVEFDSQTKQSLSSSTGQKVLYSLIKDKMTTYMEENPDFSKMLIEKTLRAKKFREKQEKLEEDLKKEENNRISTGILPGKLANCRSKDIRVNELFIVEGDSAGGSAKQGRESAYQAILPLKGKILNVLKADLEKVLKSKEIATLKTAIGAGIGETYNENKIRFGKTIVLTDADDDGLHISTLLLAFFYKYMPSYIKEGRLFIAQPPLYKVTKKSGKGTAEYYYNDAHLNSDFPNGFDSSRYERQRFKGLGEMNPQQLKETTMMKGKRSLYKVIYNQEHKEHIDSIFEMLMGETNEKRKEFFMNNDNFKLIEDEVEGDLV